MLRLKAMNEQIAVYIRDDSAPGKKPNGFKYVNGLLEIRSAKGLVEFLEDNPHVLRPQYSFASVRLESDSAEKPKGWLKFSEQSLLKDGVLPDGVDYFDAWVDLVPPADKVGPTWGRRADVYTLHIRDLEDLAERIDALLRMAAISNGESSFEDVFRFDEEFDVPQRDGLQAYGTRFWVKKETIARMMPGETYSFFKAYKISDGYRDKDDPVLPLVIYDDFGDRVEFLTSRDRDDAAREAAGVIVAYALTAWLKWSAAPERVSYSLHGGFDYNGAEASEVANELVDIVFEKRFKICPSCGRAFVSRKTFTGRSNEKKQCSGSCRTSANKAKGKSSEK